MLLVAQLNLDDKSAQVIKNIWKELIDFGTGRSLLDRNFIPHITLAAFQTTEENLDRDIALIETALLEIVQDLNSFLVIQISHIGIFNSPSRVVYYGATTTVKLLNVHSKLHKKLNEIEQYAISFYLPGKFVAHVALCLNLSENELSQVIDAVSKIITMPFDVDLTSVSLVHIPLAGADAKEISKYVLKQA